MASTSRARVRPLSAPALQQRPHGPARAATSTCATRRAATTGRPPGSRWASRSTRTSPPAATARPTRSSMSRYGGIHTETTYFVPLGQTFEYWRLKVTNESDRPRRLAVFSLLRVHQPVEHAAGPGQPAILALHRQGRTDRDGLLRIAIQDNLTPEPGEGFVPTTSACTAGWGWSVRRWPASTPAARPFSAPTAATTTRWWWSTASAPTATPTATTPAAACRPTWTCSRARAASCWCCWASAMRTPWASAPWPSSARWTRAEAELERLKQSWHGKLGSLVVETPDQDLNHTVNVWGLYNCLITFAWSRAASLVYNGERDGLGFRDSVQDILGVVAAIPDEARARLELMLTGQLANGGAMPIVKPFEHHPGHEQAPGSEEYRSRRLPVVLQRRAGLRGRDRRLRLLQQGAALRRPGRGTVFGHLRRALEFNLERTGRNQPALRPGRRLERLPAARLPRREPVRGLPGAPGADRLRGDRRAAGQAGGGALGAGPTQEAGRRTSRRAPGTATGSSGPSARTATVYGTKNYPEGQVYLNTQVWAVLSGAATPSRPSAAWRPCTSGWPPPTA